MRLRWLLNYWCRAEIARADERALLVFSGCVACCLLCAAGLACC